MLASGMEEQCRTYVVNRFTASMMTSDPLNTYYTLMLGRTPSAVKVQHLHVISFICLFNELHMIIQIIT